jgi:hypothetical protein
MYTAFYCFINVFVCGLTKDYIIDRISTWQDKMIITMRIDARSSIIGLCRIINTTTTRHSTTTAARHSTTTVMATTCRNTSHGHLGVIYTSLAAWKQGEA